MAIDQNYKKITTKLLHPDKVGNALSFNIQNIQIN